ncbi:MAG: HEAT repeat domain-containing protein [Armatimonadetes bacterium]|nr:HEAT repeat domain-containing protein [Armatimonadota bacterium]
MESGRLFCCAVFLVCFTVWTAEQAESASGENSVARWLAQIRNPNPAVRAKSAYAFAALSLPDKKADSEMLAASLSDPDPFVRRQAAVAAAELDADPRLVAPALAQALFDGEESVQRGAVFAMARIGPPAASFLVKIIAEPERFASRGFTQADYAAFILSSSGPSVVPDVLRLANAYLAEDRRPGDVLVGNYARFILSRIGPPAVPSLIDALKSPSLPTCSLAVAALAAIASPEQLRQKAVLSGLLDALGSRDFNTEYAALHGLARIQPKTGPITARIIARLNELKPVPFSGNLFAGVSPEGVRLLAQAYSSPQEGARREFGRALIALGSAAKTAAPAFLSALQDSKGRSRRQPSPASAGRPATWVQINSNSKAPSILPTSSGVTPSGSGSIVPSEGDGDKRRGLRFFRGTCTRRATSKRPA